MPHPLGFEALKGILHRRIAQLPDHRTKGPNTRYALHDAALGAFGIFFTQSASFLEYQRQLQQTKGYTNAHTLLGAEQIPCDKQVRTRLDPIAPSHLDAVFVEVFEGLGRHQLLFVQSHSLPQLSHPATHQWPDPLLSCRHHPGDRLPWPVAGHCVTP